MIAALLRHYGTWALFTALRLVFLAMLFAGLSLGYDVLSGQDTDFLTPLGVSGMGAMFLLALSVAPRTLSPWALRRLQALEPRAAVLSLVSSDSTFAKYELIDERGTRTFTLPDMACPGWSQPKDELLEVEARGEREGLWWIQDPFGKTFRIPNVLSICS